MVGDRPGLIAVVLCTRQTIPVFCRGKPASACGAPWHGWAAALPLGLQCPDHPAAEPGPAAAARWDRERTEPDHQPPRPDAVRLCQRGFPQPLRCHLPRQDFPVSLPTPLTWEMPSDFIKDQRPEEPLKGTLPHEDLPDQLLSAFVLWTGSLLLTLFPPHRYCRWCKWQPFQIQIWNPALNKSFASALLASVLALPCSCSYLSSFIPVWGHTLWFCMSLTLSGARYSINK